MKERPILFSAPMVRALLDGGKTQTRRALKVQPWSVSSVESGNHIFDFRSDKADLEKIADMAAMVKRCPYGQPGDRLWVRETWQTHVDKDDITPRDLPSDSHVQYPATYDGWVSKRRPSMFMPRWASRITLEITGVRAERLNDISEADAKAEGCTYYEPANYLSHGGWSHDGRYVHKTALASFEQLWNSINGAGSWDANPWVWIVEFKVLKP